MENASKALIIAGAILLAIVIISLGLVVVNNVRDNINGANMNQQEVETFNDKFTVYGGDKVSGTKVKALINVISSNNAAQDASGKEFSECTYVNVDASGATVATGDDSVEITAVNATGIKYPTFSTSKYFKVEFEYNKGIVSKVIISNV